jgi:hypothetical protein
MEDAMFTLEMGGRPVAKIQADQTEAREFFEDQTFKDDMRRWLSDGQPILDGKAD